MRYSILFKIACVVVLTNCMPVKAQENNLPVTTETFVDTGNSQQFSTSAAEWEKQISRLNALNEAARKDLEIALLRDKKEREHAQANVWASLAISVALASFIIMYSVIRNQKKRRHKVEAEKKLKEHELQETRTRLHHNVKLMDGFTQRILEKNKVIAELERKIRSNPFFNQSTENARKNLEAISEIRILTNDDWEKFQSNVNKVYPGLINRICDSFPLITDAELRMFLLIKLSVKNKDVSEILGISPDSVRKTRFRLKKKLNLAEEDDLVDFIMDYNGADSVSSGEKLG